MPAVISDAERRYEDRTASAKVRVYDGKPIEFSNLEKEEIKQCCVGRNEVGQGSFGKVFRSTNANKRCGIVLATKKIENPPITIVGTVQRSSRILHQNLLPLLAAFTDDRIYYMVSPYCAHGDLYSVLKDKRDNPQGYRVKLNQLQRIRITLQVALALQYLHDPLKNGRERYLHLNLSSKKILLDERNNVRLIHHVLEAGAASAQDQQRLYYHSNDLGYASEKWDYFSFAVVIRELLTGKDPVGKTVYLKDMDLQQVKGYADQDIWPVYEDSESEASYDTLSAVADCLRTSQDGFSLVVAIETLKDLTRGSAVSNGRAEDIRCMLCVVNTEGSEAAENMQHRGNNCREQLRLCVSCEKHSLYIPNPVSCAYCDVRLDPLGSHWGALLVAGNDVVDEQRAIICKENVEFMKLLLTSRLPNQHIIGMSEDNVIMVAVEKPGLPNYKQKLIIDILMAINQLKGRQIHTLLVYFSCKSDMKGTVLQLGSEDDDQLILEVLQVWLKGLTRVKTVIMLSDARTCPLVDLDDKVVVQISACGISRQTTLEENPDEFTELKGGMNTTTVADGGLCEFVGHNNNFTRYLKQGLQSRCDKPDCRNCRDVSVTGRDYISAEFLLDFIIQHLQPDEPRPVAYFTGNTTVAFFTNPTYSQSQNWGALLVAGNDAESLQRAEVFLQDVINVKTALTSKQQWPFLVGIREENVKVVSPRRPGHEQYGEFLVQQVSDALDELKNMHIETLVIYFSCRGDEKIDGKFTGNYLQLGSIERLTADFLQGKLNEIRTVKNIIVVVDQRLCPLVGLGDVVLAQIGACHPQKTTTYSASGSRFTKYLMHGLRGKCDKFLCSYCRDFRIICKENISASKLLDFITHHVERDDPKPFGYFTGDPIIAFSTDDDSLLASGSTEEERDMTRRMNSLG